MITLNKYLTIINIECILKSFKIIIFKKMAKIVSISIMIKCLNKNNENWANSCVNDPTPEIYYHVTVAVPYID